MKRMFAGCKKLETIEMNDFSIFPEFKKELGGMELTPLGRYEFYDACKEDAVLLAISTGEKRLFANILLTIGCA